MLAPSSSQLPQISGNWLLGVLLPFLKDPLHYFEHSERYDTPFVRLRIAHKRIFYVKDYDVLIEMLRNWRVFQKGAGKMAKSVLGSGLVLAEEEDWTQQRRVIAPAFHHKALLSYQEIMHQQAERKLNEWEAEQAQKGHVDLTQGFFEVAIRILRDCLFGTHADEAELQVALEGIDRLLQHLIAKEKNPLLPPLWVPTPRNFASKRHIRQIRKLVLQSIHERQTANDGQSTLIDMMSHGRNNGEGLSDENIIDQVKIFFVAGTETSSNTMNFVAYELAKNPTVFQQLQQEIDNVLKGQPLAIQDLGKLPLLRQVINETLRLYPATWINTRQNVVDTEIGGYHFKAGSYFMFSTYLLQRSEKGWEAPDEFRPSRWEQAGDKPAYYIPFLTGPRKCIGDQFSLAEMSIMLTRLIQRYEWSLPSDFKAQLNPGATLQLKPNLELFLKKRQDLNY